MTSEEINALPERVRAYIHHIEAEGDPAGTLRENFHLREQVTALQKIVADEKAERKHAVFCSMLQGMLANPALTPSKDSMDIGNTIRRAEDFSKGYLS